MGRRKKSVKPKVEEKEQKQAPVEPAEPEQEPEPDKDYFSRVMNHYHSLLQEEPRDAVKVYGLTLLHSLSTEEKMEYAPKLRIAPNSSEEFFNLGVVAVNDNKVKKAADYFKKAWELNPHLYDALFNLALCYEELNDADNAAKCWEEYLEKSPIKGEDRKKIRKHYKGLKNK